MEVLSARDKWSASGSRHSSRSRLRDDDGPHSVERRVFDFLNKWEESPRGRSTRTGGQPPRSSSSASREKRPREIERDWVGWRASSTLRDGVREEIAIGQMKVRSRSVGLDFRVEKAGARKLAPF